MNPEQIPFSRLIPTNLHTPYFIAAWSEWVDERRIRRHSITERGARLQLKHCAQWGPERSVDSINQSIECGWTGLFEPQTTLRINGHVHGKPQSVYELREIMKAKEIQAQEIKRKHCSEVATGLQWNDPKAKVQYFELRRGIKLINEKIASVPI